MKIKSKTYVNVHELHRPICVGEVVEVSAKIANQYIEAGLAEKAPNNAKIGRESIEDGLKRLKEEKIKTEAIAAKRKEAADKIAKKNAKRFGESKKEQKEAISKPMKNRHFFIGGLNATKVNKKSSLSNSKD